MIEDNEEESERCLSHVNVPLHIIVGLMASLFSVVIIVVVVNVVVVVSSIAVFMVSVMFQVNFVVFVVVCMLPQ